MGAAILLAGLALIVIAAGWPAATLANGPVLGHGWMQTTLDLPGPVTAGVALALGPDGTEHLAYLVSNGSGSSTAYHTVLSDATWINEAIGTPAASTPSLVVGADGIPQVAYTRQSPRVTYGVQTSTDWITSEVDSEPGNAGPTIAVDSLGNPAIAYHDARPPLPEPGRGVMFANWNGSAWLTEVMDGNAAGCGFDCDPPGLGIQTPADVPHVALRPGGTGQLIYLTRPAATWISQTVEVTGTRRPVLQVNSAGDVSIAYEYEGASIRYAWNEASVWYTETAEANFAAPVSLAVDSFGRPHLAYCDPRELAPAGPGGGLRHAWRSPTGWVSEEMASVACTSASLALDARNNPRIAYYNSASGALSILRWVPLQTDAVIPATGGLLVATSGEAALTFGAGVFSDTATVTHTVAHWSTVPEMELLQAPGQVGNAFTLEAVYPDGSAAAPGEPFTLTVTYDDGGRGTVTEAGLSLYWYDGNAWVAEPSTVNPVFNTVTATPTHFSLWAVFGEPLRTFLPIVLRAH
jgi:hypothetical protein